MLWFDPLVIRQCRMVRKDGSMRFNFFLGLAICFAFCSCLPQQRPTNLDIQRAIERSQFDVLRRLSNQEANRPMAFGGDRQRVISPLHYASYEGNPAAVEILMQRGATNEVRDWAGRTPLMWAVGQTRNEVSPEQKLAITVALLHGGAKPSDSDNDGRTTLMWATEGNSLECVRLLLQKGAPVQTRDKSGNSALHFADSVEIARELLNAGSKVAETNAAGETPYETARRRGNQEIARFLRDGL